LFNRKKNYIFAKKIKDLKIMSINTKKMEKCQNISVVYDISLDGSVVNALGMNIVSNTDG
jgi:hypothetical protein